ncbi:MAG TPA: LLM class flavin-dependent oxidoreductase [Solirubrobacteraceae bacterium]|jgi:5,10-methylenetetrahydromethanopterin reductase
MGLDVSIGISPRESLADWMRLASELEAGGVDRIWLIDSQLAMKDVYAGLITAALNTSTVELGPGVTNLLTRDPTVTASAIAAVSEVSGGRALLGVGAGDSAVKGLGRRPSRIAELEEGLGRLRRLLGGAPANADGETLSLPYAPGDVRLHLAVSRPRMCRLAGRVADGAIIMGPATSELVREQVGWIHEGVIESGRDASEVELSFVAPTSIEDGSDDPLRDVRSWASAQARLLADVAELPPTLEQHREELTRAKTGYDYGEHLSTRASHQDSISDELTAKLAIAGSAERCAGRLKELRAAGIERLIFPLTPPARLARLEKLRELLQSPVPKGAR